MTPQNEQNEPRHSEKRSVNIAISGEQKPLFSNSIQVSVTNEEVVLQFAFIRPQTNQGTLVSEIVLTPQHAIKFQKALDDTIKRHFTKHIE